MYELSNESKKELLRTARSAVKAAVEKAPIPAEPLSNPELQIQAGCFVTLKTKGVLRGCIGTFGSRDPLWKTVREMATASATQDPRFHANRIRPEEVPDLDIEISVLTPMRPIQDPLKEIGIGQDGIVVQLDNRSGTLLPQVATEYEWSVEEFLGYCSRDKAGIGWDGWKHPDAKIFAYTAIIMDEAEFKSAS